MIDTIIQKQGALALKKKLGSKQKVKDYYRKLQKRGVAARKRKKKNALPR